MSGTTYVVTLSLQTQGGFASAVGGLTQKANQAHSSVMSLGQGMYRLGEAASSVGAAIGGAMDRAAGLAAKVAAVGALGAIGLLGHDVVTLNRDLETTQISLGAIFNAQGVANGMNAGMQLASTLMKEMRKDAAALPGEFSDLAGIFKMISTPALQAGANVEKIRKLASQTMASSAVFQIPGGFQQGGREMAELLEGRARASNTFGQLLGISGHKIESFNAESASQRMQELSKALGKFDPAIEAFSHSFEGSASTFRDNIKLVRTELTKPLFTSLSVELESANGWFTKNQEAITRLSQTVGDRLVVGWETVVDRVRDLYPLVVKVGEAALKMKPGDWGSLGMKVAGGALAARAVPAALSVGGSALSAGGKLMSSLGGAEGMGAAASSLMAAFNPVVLGAAAGAATLFATALVSVAGAIHAVTDDTSAFHERASALWGDIISTGETAFGSLQRAFTTIQPALMLFVDSMGTSLLYGLDKCALSFAAFASGLEKIAEMVMGNPMARLAMKAMPGMDPGALESAQYREKWGMRDDPGHRGADASIAKAIAKAGGGGGGGGTKIGRIEIRVEGAGDPNRIARLVATHIEKIGRNPTSSRHVPSYVRDNNDGGGLAR